VWQPVPAIQNLHQEFTIWFENNSINPEYPPGYFEFTPLLGEIKAAYAQHIKNQKDYVPKLIEFHGWGVANEDGEWFKIKKVESEALQNGIKKSQHKLLFQILCKVQKSLTNFNFGLHKPNEETFLRYILGEDLIYYWHHKKFKKLHYVGKATQTPNTNFFNRTKQHIRRAFKGEDSPALGMALRCTHADDWEIDILHFQEKHFPNRPIFQSLEEAEQVLIAAKKTLWPNGLNLQFELTYSSAFSDKITETALQYMAASK